MGSAIDSWRSLLALSSSLFAQDDFTGGYFLAVNGGRCAVAGVDTTHCATGPYVREDVPLMNNQLLDHGQPQKNIQIN